jgi:hypothetical protein
MTPEQLRAVQDASQHHGRVTCIDCGREALLVSPEPSYFVPLAVLWFVAAAWIVFRRKGL